MADISSRVPQNAPGKFYVDDTCIYCDLCVEIVPTVYAEHKDSGNAYVLRDRKSTRLNSSHGMCSRHETQHSPRLRLAPPCSVSALSGPPHLSLGSLGVFSRRP